MDSKIETTQQQPVTAAVASKDGLGQRLSVRGERVKMTADAIEAGANVTHKCHHKPTTGVVTGESKDGKFIWVRRDGGYLSARRYSSDLWELA